MAYFEKVTGKRVFLSPMTAYDAELITSWNTDTEIGVYNGISYLHNAEAEREFLKNEISKIPNYFAFVIVVRDGLRPIGYCSLKRDEASGGNAGLGIIIGDKDFLGLGYGTEVVNLLLDYGFCVLNVHSIYLEVDDINKRAVACYKKCGFQEAGRRREAQRFGERYYDILIMDKLASEHETNYLYEYLNK